MRVVGAWSMPGHHSSFSPAGLHFNQPDLTYIHRATYNVEAWNKMKEKGTKSFLFLVMTNSIPKFT